MVAAQEHVDTGPAREDVVTASARQPVVAVVTPKRVDGGPACEDVVAGPSVGPRRKAAGIDECVVPTRPAKVDSGDVRLPLGQRERLHLPEQVEGHGRRLPDLLHECGDDPVVV